jgi:hypothetical protein
MPRRLHCVLAVLFTTALALPSSPVLAKGKARAKGKNAALCQQMQQVANRFVSAIRRSRPLRGFMSKRVTVTYRTDDRSEGAYNGKTVAEAAAIDGSVTVPGMTGGQAWVPKNKKIKPRPKTMKLHVGKTAYAILKEIRESGRRGDLITVDKKALTLYIESTPRVMTFHFRLEGKVLRVYKLSFSEEDPG